MLGFKAFVAKSRELTTKLELSAAGGASPADLQAAASTTAATATAQATPVPPPAAAPLVEGSSDRHAFLRLRQAQMDKALVHHHALVASGDELAAALAQTRSRLLDEAESAQFLAQNFHLVARVRQQLGHLRGLVNKIAEDVEDVENLLSQRTEEYMAKQNAEFAVRQQEELERFEEQILHEKEGRKRALLEERRQRLAQAFHNDLKTYQTLVTYQGVTTASALAESTEPAVSAKETLESIDLVVEADAEQLDAFYDSDSTSETELTPRFSAPKSPEVGSPRSDAKPTVNTTDDVDPSAIPDDVAEDEEKDEEREVEDTGTSQVEATEINKADEESDQVALPAESVSTEKQGGDDLGAVEKAA